MAGFGINKTIEQYLAQAEAAAKAAMSDRRYSRDEQERQANSARQAAVAKARGEAKAALESAAGAVDTAERGYRTEAAKYAASLDYSRLLAEQAEVSSLARTAPSWEAVQGYVSAASGDAYALRAWRTLGLEQLLARSRSQGDALSNDKGAIVDVRAQMLAASEQLEPAALREARGKLEKALVSQRQVVTEIRDVSGWYGSDGVKEVSIGGGGLFRDLLTEPARTVTIDAGEGRSVTFRQGGGSVFG